MPGTFSQIYIQYVFAIKGRQNFINKQFEEEVYKYISGNYHRQGTKVPGGKRNA